MPEGGDILVLPFPSVRPSVCHTWFPIDNSRTPARILMKLHMHTYLMGILAGIGARQNPCIFNEPAGL